MRFESDNSGKLNPRRNSRERERGGGEERREKQLVVGGDKVEVT